MAFLASRGMFDLFLPIYHKIYEVRHFISFCHIYNIQYSRMFQVTRPREMPSHQNFAFLYTFYVEIIHRQSNCVKTVACYKQKQKEKSNTR